MTHPPTPAELRDRIRKSGLRSTSARVAVLQKLEDATSPLTHADLADALAPLGFDKATVYRNLMDLSEVGLLSRSEHGDHVWRFELRRPGHHHDDQHPHFLCLDCGEVSCLEDVTVTISPPPGSKKSSIGELTEVVLKGHCGKCSSKE